MIMRMLLAAGVLTSVTGEELLTRVTHRYSSAEGIQWSLQSVVRSDIFDESDTTQVELAYSPPDTFALISAKEKIMGIGDTLWVLSERHKQVQKKDVTGTVMPADFILTWKDDYNLERHEKNGSFVDFYLSAKEGINPPNLLLTTDSRDRIRSISYPDAKGDIVTLTVEKEKLKRPEKYDLFFMKIPEGYEFIDLTE